MEGLELDLKDRFEGVNELEPHSNFRIGFGKVGVGRRSPKQQEKYDARQDRKGRGTAGSTSPASPLPIDKATREAEEALAAERADVGSYGDEGGYDEGLGADTGMSDNTKKALLYGGIALVGIIGIVIAVKMTKGAPASAPAMA